MKRGRKSAADLKVIVGDFGKHDDAPPPGLTDRQSEIWRSVISTEAPGMFGSAALRAILADYCRHRESGEMVSAVVGAFLPEWLKTDDGIARYKVLIQMRELETRAATSLATKLRLTNQSRYLPQTAARQARDESPKFKNPWDE